MAISIFSGQGSGLTAKLNNTEGKGQAANATAKSTPTAVFAGTQKLTKTAVSSDSFRVNQRTTSFAEKQTTKAARTISDANSFNSIAQKAAGEIFELAGKLNEIATQLEGAVLGSDVDDLKQKADDIISQIDTVADSAEFKGESVISNGGQQFSFELRAGDESSATNVLIQVDSAALDSESLGIAGLSGESIANDPSAAVESLQSAGLTISGTVERLDATEQQIKNSATEFKDFRAKEEEAVASERSEARAVRIADQISKESIENVVQEASGGLQPARVQELLEVEEDEDSSESKKSSDEDEDLAQQAIASGQENDSSSSEALV